MAMRFKSWLYHEKNDFVDVGENEVVILKPTRDKYFDVGDSIRPSPTDKSPEAFNDKINC